jgi:hypothetical protein
MSKLDNIKNIMGSSAAKFSALESSSPILYKTLLVVIALFTSIIIIIFINKIYKRYSDYTGSSLWILDGTKSAKKALVIPQNPAKSDAITLPRSSNEEGGLEFSYSFWTFIDDWSYKYGEWKHIMHKGNDSSWPNRAPGIWLHPKDNTMRVYMNTVNTIGEYVDVANIPMNKWFYTVVSVRQKNLDVFINGNLAKSKQLDNIPKQNAGDLYINSFRGFSGFLSNIKYSNYYMPFAEMDKYLNDGPSSKPSVDTNEKPPYLSQNWWANSK